MRFSVMVTAAVVLTAGGASPAVAAELAGEAVAVIQSASAEGAGGNRILEVAGQVFMGDRVITGLAGQAQLLFRDDTRMVVGPNSQMTIDRFVYAGNQTATAVSIDAVRGAFRFITGNSVKTAYNINTPVATIGVRGTEFDVAILDDGTANLVFYGNGSVRYCTKQRPRRCTLIDEPCTLVIVTPERDLRWITNVYERTSVIEELFPFAFSQGGLQPDFLVESHSCNIREFFDPLDPAFQSDSGPPPEEDGDKKGGY